MKDLVLPLILVPILGFAIDVIVLLIWQHLFRPVRLFHSVVSGFAAGLIFVAGWRDGRRMDGGGDWLDAGFILIGNLTIYPCLAYLFYNVLNMGESAIRVRILRVLAEAGGSMKETEFFQQYNNIVVLKRRLERLQKHGQIKQIEGRFILSSNSILVVARIFRGLRMILTGKESQFQQARR